MKDEIKEKILKEIEEIKTTRDLGVWFTNIRECKNDIIMSNPINLKYLYKSWVSLDDILRAIEETSKAKDEEFIKISNEAIHNLFNKINWIHKNKGEIEPEDLDELKKEIKQKLEKKE